MSRILAFALLAGALVIAGCTGASDTQQRAVSGTAIGAAGGAVIGAIAGNAGMGAAIGAGAGLIGGLMVDKHKKEKQRSYQQGYARGSTAAHPATLPPHAQNSSAEKQLKDLKNLYDKKLITAEEYTARRKKILDKM